MPGTVIMKECPTAARCHLTPGIVQQNDIQIPATNLNPDLVSYNFIPPF